MVTTRSRLAALVAVLLAALAGPAGLLSTPAAAATISPPGRTAAARPASPAALPADRLHFGLASGPGSLSWMTSSGVPWRYRYTYIAGGLYSSPWPTWQDPALPPGQYALDYMRNSATAGYIPVLPYYMLLQSHRASDEATDDYNNLNNATLMRDYYANFTLLMQKAGEFGGQVMIVFEPDLWGYLQQHSGNTVASNVSASVGSSGNADVAAYPNNVQGFAQAVQHLRDLYAPQALLAYHASMWSSGLDVATDTATSLNAGAEADRTAAFFNSASPAGWNVVTDDVDDHDAGWWEAQGSPGHWWDPTNTRLPNFSRYLAWVGELHTKTARPQVAWQVPEGNQYFLTENNTTGHYQDNVAEYFMNHTSDLFAAGLVAVLFGAGNPEQTNNEDTMGDGVTNNGGVPTTDAAGGCSACNAHVSTVSDDDGGYLRMAVGRYYAMPPGAPGSVTAVAGEGAAAVSWSAAPDGGSQVTSYTVTASTGRSVTLPGSARSAVVAGLTDGGGVTFTVTALNSAGPGPGATSNSVTPQALAYTGWFTWYDLASPGMVSDNVHLVNPGNSTVNGVVVGMGLPPRAFSLGAHSQTYLSFPGAIGGPLAVLAAGRVVAVQRVQYNDSFNEVAAQPSGRAAADLWFSWYDKASAGMVSDNVHLVNPTGAPATGTVGAAGQSVNFAVAPGAGTYVTLPAGTIGGPVRVHVDSGAVLASQRVQYYGTFNEVAGRPSADAAGIVHFNWFDLASPGVNGDNVHLVNPGGTTVTGRVVIGPPSAPITSAAFSVGPQRGTYLSFSGVIGGPVTVVMDGGGTVLASQRVQYYGSFNEAAGHADAEAARAPAMPWYDLASPGMVSDNVHLLNPGGASATVTVQIPGASTVRVLAPGAETWVSFPGQIGGPVLVSSDQPVLASQRVQYYQTFNESAAG